MRRSKELTNNYWVWGTKGNVKTVSQLKRKQQQGLQGELLASQETMTLKVPGDHSLYDQMQDYVSS